MLEIKRFIFGPFETNCYVVSQSSVTGNPSPVTPLLLIDPACSNEYEQQELLDYLENQKSKIINPKLQIVATHGHLDHLWGAKWATEQWDTPVLMHDADIPMAQAMQQQYDLFGVRQKAQPFPIEKLQSEIINHKFEIIHTPGHTPGSVCFYFPEEKVLFSGDTLFRMGYGRTDLPGGDMGQLIDSLEHLFMLPADVRVFPGHGDYTTIGAERR